MKQVTVIGAGKVGATVALYTAEKRAANVILMDANEGRAAGKAMDLDQSYPLRKFDIRISSLSDWEELSRSDVVVITASVSPEPAYRNPALLHDNGDIMRAVCRVVGRFAPHAVVIVLTAPTDIMTYIAWETLGIPRSRVLGVSGVLDAARLRLFMAQAVGVRPSDASVLVLGGHGEHIVPVLRTCTISGIPLRQFLPEASLGDWVSRIRNADRDIFELDGTHGPTHAPAAAVAEMVNTVVRDRKRLLTCSVCLDGAYGFRDVCLGVPVILGREGAEKIVELKLRDEEAEALSSAAADFTCRIRSWTDRFIH